MSWTPPPRFKVGDRVCVEIEHPETHEVLTAWLTVDRDPDGAADWMLRGVPFVVARVERPTWDSVEVPEREEPKGSLAAFHTRGLPPGYERRMVTAANLRVGDRMICRGDRWQLCDGASNYTVSAVTPTDHNGQRVVEIRGDGGTTLANPTRAFYVDRKVAS